MKLRNLVIPAALVFSPLAFSATDGALNGTSSTGTTDVSITIGDLVKVSVEQDVSLTHTPGSPSTGSTGVCIYRNSDANVDVTLTSTNPGASDEFQMNDGGTNDILYTVDFSGSSTSASDVSSGTLTTISDENNTASDCAGGFSHDLDITVAAVDLDAAPAGSYSDTITILVAPN